MSYESKVMSGGFQMEDGLGDLSREASQAGGEPVGVSQEPAPAAAPKVEERRPSHHEAPAAAAVTQQAAPTQRAVGGGGGAATEVINTEHFDMNIIASENWGKDVPDGSLPAGVQPKVPSTVHDYKLKMDARGVFGQDPRRRVATMGNLGAQGGRPVPPAIGQVMPGYDPYTTPGTGNTPRTPRDGSKKEPLSVNKDLKKRILGDDEQVD